VAQHPFLILADDIDDSAMGQRRQSGDGFVVRGVVERDGLAVAFVLLVNLGHEREQGGMCGATKDRTENMIGQALEAATRGLFDLLFGITREYEENGREFQGFEREGTPGRHAANFERRIAAGIFFCLRRELEFDLPGT